MAVFGAFKTCFTSGRAAHKVSTRLQSRHAASHHEPSSKAHAAPTHGLRRFKAIWKKVCSSISRKRRKKTSENDIDSEQRAIAEALCLEVLTTFDIRIVDDLHLRISTTAYDYDADLWERESTAEDWRNFGLTVCRRSLKSEIYRGAVRDRISYPSWSTLRVRNPALSQCIRKHGMSDVGVAALRSIRHLLAEAERNHGICLAHRESSDEDPVAAAAAISAEVLTTVDILVVDQPWLRISTMPYDYEKEQWERESTASQWQETGICICLRLKAKVLDSGELMEGAANIPLPASATPIALSSPRLPSVYQPPIRTPCDNRDYRNCRVKAYQDAHQRVIKVFDQAGLVACSQDPALKALFRSPFTGHSVSSNSKNLLACARVIAGKGRDVIDDKLMDPLDEEISNRAEVDRWFQNHNSCGSDVTGHTFYTQLLLNARHILSSARQTIDMVEVPW